MTATPNEESRTLDQIGRIIRQRWWIVVVCVVLTGGSAVLFSSLQRKEYTSSASLLFRTTGFDQILFGTAFAPPTVDPTRQAATNLDLISLPTVAAHTAALIPGLTEARVRSEVTVSPAGQADVASISATDPSARRAAKIANTYARQYLASRIAADQSKLAGAVQVVNQQLAKLTSAQKNGSYGQGLQTRANQLKILRSLQTGGAELVQQAVASRSPSSPRPRRNALVGLLLGLLVGIGLVFLLERLDRRLRDSSALEEAYGAPVLGMVPNNPAYAITNSERLSTGESEAFALLRSRLKYFNVDRDIRSLLLTSSGPGDGKTTVAFRLAAAETIGAGTDVVLVEGDLRRPTLAKQLGMDPAPGLSEILSRSVTLNETLRRVELSSHSTTRAGASAAITVITAGAIPPNPGELIESQAMSNLLTALSERFDLVVIDTPPMGIVSDSIPLVRLVSGVVIVSRVSRTTRDSARHLRDQLRKLDAPLLGVVANAVAPKGGGYYGYGYGYGYGDYEPTEEQSVARSDVSGPEATAVDYPPRALSGPRTPPGTEQWVTDNNINTKNVTARSEHD